MLRVCKEIYYVNLPGAGSHDCSSCKLGQKLAGGACVKDAAAQDLMDCKSGHYWDVLSKVRRIDVTFVFELTIVLKRPVIHVPDN